MTFHGSSEKAIVLIRLTVLHRHIFSIACKHVNDHNNSIMRERKPLKYLFLRKENGLCSALPHSILFFFFMQITLTEKWIVLFQDL